MKRLLVVFILFLVSCANPYSQFYKGVPDARQSPQYEPVQAELQIYSTDDFDRDTRALMRRGYSPIGQASFNAASNNVTEAQVREQAAKVGAHVVLVSSKYTHTISGAIPLTVPQTSTSYSTGTATAYGPGGTVNAYGSGVTTTYSTQTTMMPYSIARSDFAALFFAKTKGRVGIHFRPLDDETRKRLQTNSGVKVIEVVEGSPAFQADVLPGDVVLEIAYNRVHSLDDVKNLLIKYEGQTVMFLLDPDGKVLQKQIEIRSYNQQPAQ